MSSTTDLIRTLIDEAFENLAGAEAQMIDSDDPIICDRARRALSAVRTVRRLLLTTPTQEGS